MNKISFEEFKKLEIRVGKIIEAKKVDNSDKLLKLKVDFGTEQRQIISGIAKEYLPKELINSSFVFVTNLESRMIMGLESQGMILAADADGKAVCLSPTAEVVPGTLIR